VRDRASVTPPALLALMILCFAPVSFLYNGLAANATPSLKNDFTSYYVAGLAVRQGIPEALYYPQPVGSLLAQASQQRPWIDLARPAGIEHPNYYLYPPLFAVLFAPMTLLPYKMAYVVWVGVGFVCLALSVGLMLRRLPRPWAEGGASDGAWLALAGVALTVCLFYPVARNFAVGQSSLLLLLLMTTCLVMLARGTARGDWLAGLALAGGILLKLTPLIFVPWLAMRRRWRALACCAVWLAALAGISIAVVGLAPHRIYFTQIVPLLSGGTAFYPNQSLAGLCARAWGADLRLADLTAPDSAPVIAARLAGLLLVAVSFFMVYRTACRGVRPGWTGDDDRAFCILLLTSLAVSPISWEHHYVLALIPAWVILAAMVRGDPRYGPRAAAACGLALALIGSYIGLRVIGALGEAGPWAQASASAGLAGAGILWWLMSRPARTDPAPPPRVTSQAALLITLSVFAAGSLAFKLAEYSQAYAYGDFTSYYVAAATLVEAKGDPLYYPDTPDMILARAETPSPWTETAARFGVRDANYYLYPPFFAMAMTPLALLAYGTAHGVWYLVNLAALAAAVWLYLRSRRAELSQAEIALAVIGVSLSWPALFTFGAGQANWIVLLMLVGALACLRARRDIPAGLLVAGAAAVKLTPVLMLVWLAWRRRWAAVGAACAALGLLVAAGWGAAGWNAYVVYAREMVPLLSRGCAHWVNQSLGAFMTRLFDAPDIFSWALADPSTIARLASTGAGLAMVAASFWIIHQAGSRHSPEGLDMPAMLAMLDMEFCLMTVVTLFVSPISWTHHSVLSLLGFFLLARALLAAGESGRPGLTWRLAILFGIAFTLVNVHVKPPGFLQVGPLRALASYNLAGNVMLWGMLAAALLRMNPERARRAA